MRSKILLQVASIYAVLLFIFGFVFYFPKPIPQLVMMLVGLYTVFSITKSLRLKLGGK